MDGPAFYQGEDDDPETLVIREDGPLTKKGYRDLKVYRSAHDLGVKAHHLSMRLPKHELYETGSQLRRAAKSVSANIVEGYGRRCYKAEYLRFLTYAKASLDETEEHLQYVHDCHPNEQETATTLLKDAYALGCKLSRFIDLVEANHRV